MSYKVKAIHTFKRNLKRLAKKYPSIKQDYSSFLDLIKEKPATGIAIGKNCFKIRLAISSKGQGKSGGARIITCVYAIKETVYLLNIYDKSEIESISDAELKKLLSKIDEAN